MATRPDPGFFIVGIEGPIWDAYCSWFTARGKPTPPFVSDGLFVVAGHGTAHPVLAAGCCIYPCDGPFAVVEYSATNPNLPARVAHGAMVFGAKALTAYGAMRKKTMLCFPRSAGMAKVLERSGFLADNNVLVMAHGPWSER